jgi:hypothetical protein
MARAMPADIANPGFASCRNYLAEFLIAFASNGLLFGPFNVLRFKVRYDLRPDMRASQKQYETAPRF